MKYWIGLLVISLVSFAVACIYTDVRSELPLYNGWLPLLAIISLFLFVVSCVVLGGGNYGGRPIEGNRFDDQF
ncbi:hypothetical protein [Motilimonas eburnea]|uniref:hypothetical protein n=1 Tax=Motilimonas eburnea TaxID=1737488 RepID=UPI001E3BDC8A|nr:hypothetical protein [Motilimonas eburnea]MCE2572396.1 hypothetical protein [Motilimonas eburnea]